MEENIIRTQAAIEAILFSVGEAIDIKELAKSYRFAYGDTVHSSI